MKKILCLLFLLLLLPLNVLANDGSEDFQAYKAIVNNKNGAVLSEFRNEENKITIPYDTVIIIDYEYLSDGVLFGSTTYNKISGSINLSDTILKNNKYTPTEKQKAEKVEKVYVYKANGVKMFAGPSMKYDTLATIPCKTILSYQYFDDTQQWIWTTYNNISGWVLYSQQTYLTKKYNTDSGVADVYNGSIYTISDKIKIITEPFNDSAKTLTTIPKNTILDYLYSAPYGESDEYWVYVSYKKISGWVNAINSLTDDSKDDTLVAIGNQNGTDNNILITAKQGIKMFSDPKYFDSIYTIPYNQIIKVFFRYSKYSSNYSVDYYYVEYNGKKGWVIDEGFDYLIYGYYDEEYTTLNETTLYEEYSKNSKVISTIPKNTKLHYTFEYNKDYGSTWEYVTYENKSGWIIRSYNIDDESSDNDSSSIVKNKFSPNYFAIGCIIFAVELSLIAYVTIKKTNNIKTFRK